jgi:hypothetical protein
MPRRRVHESFGPEWSRVSSEPPRMPQAGFSARRLLAMRFRERARSLSFSIWHCRERVTGVVIGNPRREGPDTGQASHAGLGAHGCQRDEGRGRRQQTKTAVRGSQASPRGAGPFGRRKERQREGDGPVGASADDCLQNIRHQRVEVLSLVDSAGSQMIGLGAAQGDTECQGNLAPRVGSASLATAALAIFSEEGAAGRDLRTG